MGEDQLLGRFAGFPSGFIPFLFTSVSERRGRTKNCVRFHQFHRRKEIFASNLNSLKPSACQVDMYGQNGKTMVFACVVQQPDRRHTAMH